jgi:hypothetical protein
MRDGASRPFILSCGIRRFALIASQKSHDTFCFCLYRAINSGRELVCAKKNLRLISKRIVRFLIATPRGRRTYPEKKSNRWRITCQCAVRRAKPAVSRDICGREDGQCAHRGEWLLSVRNNRHGSCWLNFRCLANAMSLTS